MSKINNINQNEHEERSTRVEGKLKAILKKKQAVLSASTHSFR